jgi:hypothetical protein
MGEEPGFGVCTVDLAKVDEARKMVPSLTHDRDYALPVAPRRPNLTQAAE